MNNKQAVGWIILAIVVMGASLWYLAGTSSSTGGNVATSTSWTATTTQTGTDTTMHPKPTGTPAPVVVPLKTAGEVPLTSLLGMKQNLRCAVSTIGVTTKRSGTLYVSALGKAYGIFTGSVNGVTTTVNMIDDSANLYVWTAGSSTGFKGLAATSANGSAAASRGGVDPSQKLAYSCGVWAPDQNIFVVPATVTFTNN